MKTSAAAQEQNRATIQGAEMMKQPATASLGNKPVVERAKSGFDPLFESKLMAMVAASGGRLKIVSGFRSTQRQQQLWDAALKKYGSAKAARKWVAPPGKSNHEKGQAADLSGDLSWAHKNAARFGLHFPMAHEKWHVEPIGLRGAKVGHTPAPTITGTHQHAAEDAAVPTAVDPEAEAAAARRTVTFQLNSLVSLLASGGDEDV